MIKLAEYSEVMMALSESEAGESLKNTHRWSGFRTDETNEEWRAMLGATEQDYSHGILNYQIARIFVELEGSRFTDEQKETFLWGALCHDWGEAILNGEGVGDVSSQLKTSDDERGESVIFRRVIESLDLPDETKAKLLNGYEQVVEGGDSDLQLAFKALEKSEYVMTVIKVFQNSQKLLAGGKTGPALEIPMEARVIVINLATVLDKYAYKYPESIGRYFYNMSETVDEMFESCLPWLMTTTEWDGKVVDHADLANELWTKWNTFKQAFRVLE